MNKKEYLKRQLLSALPYFKWSSRNHYHLLKNISTFPSKLRYVYFIHIFMVLFFHWPISYQGAVIQFNGIEYQIEGKNRLNFCSTAFCWTKLLCIIAMRLWFAWVLYVERLLKEYLLVSFEAALHSRSLCRGKDRHLQQPLETFLIKAEIIQTILYIKCKLKFTN